MKKIKTILFPILSIIFLATCSTPSLKPELAANKRNPVQDKTELTEKKENNGTKSDQNISQDVEKKSDIEQADKSLDRKNTEEKAEQKTPEPQQEAKTKEDENLIINLEDISIFEFSEVVFGQFLKKNYEIDPRIKESQIKITLRMTKAVPKSKIIPLVSEVLRQYNVFLYEENDVYHITLSSEIGSIPPKIKYGKALPQISEELGMIAQIIPLDHITPVQLDFLIRRSLSKVGTYVQEPTSNSLIIVDFPERIQKILEVVELLDKDLFKDVTLQIIKPTFWEPSALVRQINELLKIESIPVLRPGAQPRGVYLLPIDRLREVYIFSSNKEWLDKILFFVENLDKAEALGGDERTFIYFPTNTSAQDLGSITSQIFSMVETPAAISEKQQQAAPQAKLSKKIIIDETRNCLIFIVSPSEWATIKNLLEKLDIPSKQVLIEAVIGELTLDNQFRLGVEWFMKNYDVKILKKEFTGQGGTEGGLGLGGLGFLYTLVAKDELFRAAISAFISQNRIKIISAPRIMGMDNKEAVIRIGTEVPIVTSEAVAGVLQQQGTTSLLRSIQYRSTGVILTVRPTIHSKGVVSLDINQEVSEAQTNSISPGIQSPIILNRSIKTNLQAKNGETIFIGGLISKNISTTKTGVPVLSKIPLLGALFRSTSQSERRTELIVLITPHIISETSEIDFVTEEFRNKMLPDIEKAMVKEKKDKNDEKK